jgi:tetratricopeptide (TPR) repeat protein
MAEMNDMRCTTTKMVTTPALLILLAALATSNAFAQSVQCGLEREVSAQALDEFTWRRLNSIYEDVGEDHFEEAYADLQRMLERAGRDIYLQAILNQALAQVEWARENFGPALQYFERAVELDALPDQTHFLLMYQIAQLYFMNERYGEALEKLESWFCQAPEDKITSAAYVLKASIHLQKMDYPEALTAIETAISMDESPEEQWFQLELAVHYELEQYPRAADTLENIISRWPDKKIYWTQLSQIYFKLKQDDRALAVMALAYRKNLLDKEADITYLSSLYSNSEVPYKAAGVLETGIRDGIVEPTRVNWALVAQAWYAAEELERSLAAYEEAGKLAANGDTDLRRGYILVDLERWPEALEALDHALQKGGLDERRTGEAYLLRGMVRFNLGDLDQAGADWGRASRYEKSRDSARQWMNHLREERRRRAS